MSNEDRPPNDVPVRWAVLVFAVIFVLASVPVWIVKYPPMVDYPMHVARAYLLSLPQDGQGITAFYEAKMMAIPNLGMDLIVAAMMRFMPALVAGKVFLSMILFALMTGSAAFSIAVQKRITLATFLPALALYDPWFFMGFANYLFGLGIAFWGIAFFLWSEDWPRPKRWLVLGLFFIALLICHLMALAVAVASCLALSVKDGPKLKATTKVFIVCTVLCVLADVGLALSGRTAIIWDGHLETVMNTFGPTMFGVVGLVAIASGVKREARIYPMLVGMLVFLVIGPSFLIGTAFASDRLSLPLLITLLGTAVFSTYRLKGIALGTALVLFVTVATVRIKNWIQMAEWSERVVTALKSVPDRSTLASVDLGLRVEPAWKFQRHVPDWILLDNKVFVAQNFAKRRQQPMVFRPEYEGWHEYQQNNPVEMDSWEQLAAAVPLLRRLHREAQPKDLEGSGALTGLYVFVLHRADQQYSLKSNPNLVVEAESDEFTLLKVR